ncbi:MAG: hypothetical protein KZQ83_04130 [gamma proteobacterium symbiont of Taylorina sp.]|nr:hypothetical protein [gamma proteobacterium symbiont of Taylorina sp.]
MKNLLALSENFVDKLTRRERILVLLGILSVLYMIWDTFLMTPIQMTQKKLNGERLTIQKQLSELEVRNILATGLLKNNNNEKFIKAIAQVKGKINELDNTIKAQLKDQVPDELMVSMLGDLLQKHQGLELLFIHNSPAEPLKKEDDTEDNSQKKNQQKNKPVKSIDKKINALGVFMHPLDIELQGSYLDILNYLIELENMGWKIFWDQVQLNVLEYPRVRVHIKVHTFSLKDGWLSV